MECPTLGLPAGDLTGEAQGHLGDVLGVWMVSWPSVSQACSRPGWPGVPGLLNRTNNSNNSSHPLAPYYVQKAHHQPVRHVLLSSHFIDNETVV